MDIFSKASDFRHACKIFDTNKKIPIEQFQSILQTGLNAPSSFGLEPTRILRISNPKVREEIKPLCWNQEQITTASELIIFKTLKLDLLANSHYVKTSFQRRVKTAEQQEAYMQRFADFQKARSIGENNIGAWCALQSYITATAMMYHAASLGIDSCMLEGFEVENLEKYFKLDRASEQITLILALGYRVRPQNPRSRIELQEFVKTI